MKNKIKVKVALVGAGPACVSSAIQLQRSGVEILIIAEGVGGSVRNANLIENLAGFPGGITGEEYTNRLIAQLDENQIPILLQKGINVEYHTNTFKVITEESEIYSEYLIVGTGSKPKKLGIKGEKKAFKTQNLFYEVCVAQEVCKNKEILIIGSGDVAYDYALNLKEFAKSITILQRTAETKSLPILQNRVKQFDNIQIKQNVIPIEIKLDSQLTLIASENRKEKVIKTDLILVAIGREPDITLLSKKLKEQYNKKSHIEKLFYVGDVKKNNYRHISIALGDGMKAAMEIVKDIRGEEGYNGTPW